MIKELTPLLKQNFHYFTTLYFEYNLEINHDFIIMFERKEFKKLSGYWKEASFFIDFLI